MKHQYKMKVLEAHLDSFGHMNNATYLQILEEARWDLIHGRGYGYHEIQETGIGPTILEVTLQFRREILLREEIVIETEMVGYEKRIGTIHQEIKSVATGELKAIADFKIGLFDTNTRRLISPTEKWLAAIGWTGEQPI